MSPDCPIFQTLPKAPPLSAPLRSGTCSWLAATMAWATVRRWSGATRCCMREPRAAAPSWRTWALQTGFSVMKIRRRTWRATCERLWEQDTDEESRRGHELSSGSHTLRRWLWRDGLSNRSEWSLPGDPCHQETKQPSPQPENRRHLRWDVSYAANLVNESLLIFTQYWNKLTAAS